MLCVTLCVLLAISSSQAVSINRQFVQQMMIDEPVDGTKVYKVPDHAVFKYLNQNSPQQGQQKVNKKGLVGIKWKDCGNKSAELISIDGLSVTPAKLSLPGDISVKFASTFKKTISSPLKMKLTVKREVFGYWVEIPCIEGVGSCTYDDLCDTLSSVVCPPILVKDKLPCKCPFEKGTYSLPLTKFHVATDPIPSGSYEVTADLSTGSEPVLCLFVEMELD